VCACSIAWLAIILSKKESTSFLKKRSKKLLLIAAGFRFKRANSVLHATDKSFLLLFFKKELLPS
jgi:hypothetical protein